LVKNRAVGLRHAETVGEGPRHRTDPDTDPSASPCRACWTVPTRAWPAGTKPQSRTIAPIATRIGFRPWSQTPASKYPPLCIVGTRTRAQFAPSLMLISCASCAVPPAKRRAWRPADTEPRHCA
jgi:hypothetical protein